MPIYTGKSADGSDMKEFEGFHVSPDGKEFSNMPYPKSPLDRCWERIYVHLYQNLRSMRDEYLLIQNKQSLLSRKERDLLVMMVENTPEDKKPLLEEKYGNNKD